MHRSWRALLPLAVFVFLAWSAAGCGSKKLLAPAIDSAPHTIIFIQGPVDTVNHVVDVHWYGTDPHGYIAGYEVRLLNPAALADTAWRFTDKRDSLVTVLTPTGFTQAVFEARAINDHGVRDPHPARQTFNFRNQPPIVVITGGPNRSEHSDTTFASVTVDWTVVDPDGDPTKTIVRVWLDGRQDFPQTAQGNEFTMPSSEFLQGGVYKSGPRTLYVQAIDDGGMAGDTASVTWYVRQPVPGTRARLLVVDDAQYTGGAKTRVDTLYSNAIARCGVDPTTMQYLHLSASQPFRSARDLAQTFGQYENVIYYRGELTSLPAVLMNYGDGVGQYLDAGGKMYLESLFLVASWSSFGPFTVDFVQHYMNSDGVFLFGQPPDSSANWGVSSIHPTVLHSPVLGDSVLAKRNIAGIRGFVSRSRSQMVLTAQAGGFTQGNLIEMPVALDVPQPSGGRFMVVTFPMVTGTVDASASDSTFVTFPFPQRASVVLLQMLQRFGLSGP
jgi:hypothetical protein